MAWRPDGDKNSKISVFVLAQLTNVTDGQTDRRTDGQTPRAGIYRADAYASRGKNDQLIVYSVFSVSCIKVDLHS